jgi:molybdate transport system substrate-binding protein
MPAHRLSLLTFALALVLGGPVGAAETVTVFAAASLKNALDDAAAAYTTKTGEEITLSYAASSALAKQIENDAPADIFASADTQWMEYLDKRGLVQPATRVDLLGNTLVVVAPQASPIDSLDLTPDAFNRAVGDGKWTTGLVASVPVGIYAKAALTKLGIWGTAQAKLAQAENVRAALTFVSRNEAALGVVYQTDANADPKVKIVATFPVGSHPPIIYPFALTKAAKGDAPRKLLAFLESSEARRFFEKQGFEILAK